MNIIYTKVQSPLGQLLLVGDGQALQHLIMPQQKAAPQVQSHWHYRTNAYPKACEQLHAYFNGKLKVFSLNLAPQGTDFQKQVWQALQTIDYGDTWHYGKLAQTIGRPKASRAVGAANGKNPIPIIIPCHRVIAANGQLTGYSAGVDKKSWLLDHEHRHMANL